MCKIRKYSWDHENTIWFINGKGRSQSNFYFMCNKIDLNYSENELNEVKKYAKDNGLEFILASSFKDWFGLEDNVFKEFINKYNNSINN